MDRFNVKTRCMNAKSDGQGVVCSAVMSCGVVFIQGWVTQQPLTW